MRRIMMGGLSGALLIGLAGCGGSSGLDAGAPTGGADAKPGVDIHNMVDPAAAKSKFGAGAAAKATATNEEVKKATPPPSTDTPK